MYNIKMEEGLNLRQRQIKDTLRQLRKEKIGYTQQQVADYLQISRSTYTYYETGKTEPDLENIKKLAKLFGVSVEELLDDAPSPKEIRSPSLIHSQWTSESFLTKEERRLIQMYRHCSAETRQKIDELLNENKSSE